MGEFLLSEIAREKKTTEFIHFTHFKFQSEIKVWQKHNFPSQASPPSYTLISSGPPPPSRDTNPGILGQHFPSSEFTPWHSLSLIPIHSITSANKSRND